MDDDYNAGSGDSTGAQTWGDLRFQGLSRVALVDQWRRAAEKQDAGAMATAWSTLIDSLWLEWADVAAYRPWLDALLPHETFLREHLPARRWCRLVRAVLMAKAHCAPGSPALRYWRHEALIALSHPEASADDRLMLASQLLYLNTWLGGGRAEADMVVKVIARAHAPERDASPLARCAWATFYGMYLWFFRAQAGACFAQVERARALTEQYGIRSWECAVPALQCALCTLDAEALDHWLGWLLRTDHKSHKPFYAHLQSHFLAGQAWLNGELPQAVDHARRSVEQLSGAAGGMTAAALRAVYARLLAQVGEGRASLAQGRAARRLLDGVEGAYPCLMVYLQLACIPMARGQCERALPYLRRALPGAARERLYFPYMVDNEELSALSALALRDGLEPDYVHALIRQRGLCPPAPAVLRLSWPMPARLQTLGAFTFEVGDERVTSQPRPKERTLLSELVLAGPQGLPQEQLAQALWPDVGATKATNNLHVTLHRLRDRLESAEAVRVEAGQVWINADCLWVDVWALCELGNEAASLSREQLNRSIELYAGDLQLEVEDEIKRGIYEETVHQAYCKLVVTLARRYLDSGGGDPAALCRRALFHLPLDEQLWAVLLQAQAHNSRALNRSLTQLTAAYENGLGMAPPPELMQLYQRLLERR